MIRNRQCQGTVEHALEVERAEVSRPYVGDHRQDEASAVYRLLLTVALRPPGSAARPSAGVEVVLDQRQALRPKLGGGDPDVESLGQLGGLDKRLGAGARRRVVAAAQLNPPQPPITAGSRWPVGHHAIVQRYDLALCLSGQRRL